MKKWIYSLLVAAPLMFSSAAQADIVYNWTGDCYSGCTGQANGVLTVADTFDPMPSVFDADQTASFISWMFESSSTSYTETAGNLTWLSPDLFVISSTPGGHTFTSSFGIWTSSNGSVNIGGGSVISAVPAPLSLALLGIGLLALGVMRKPRS